jgi:carboxymethylenebutenolidase
VPRIDVSVPTPDGTCPAALHTPSGDAGDGPWPAVAVFQDAGGVRPTFHDMAQRLADFGYVAFLPEMYYRHGPYEPFDLRTAFTDKDEVTRLMGLARSITNEMAIADTGAFLDFLAGRPEVAGTQVGTTGYCMGGRLSLLAAAHHPDRVAAAASFHGGYLASDLPASPHLVVGQITGRVHVAVAQDDDSFPPEQEVRLRQALTDGGVDFTMETYAAHHGFAVPDNPPYDAAADARHWDALRELYAATLGAPG